MDPSPGAARPRGLITVWPAAAPPNPEWPLIGRDALVAELLEDVVNGRRRAVVLAGLGGVGKTRLAAEVSRLAASELNGRVAWISLARASHQGGLASAVAAGFGIPAVEPDRVAGAVATALGDSPALLVLDSAETVRHDLRVVDRLLEHAPSLRLLITSRMAIERPGVAALPIEPLGVPSPNDAVEDVAHSPAVALLVDRAERAGADVSVTSGTAGVIGRLVARLDGLPLAIELAAPLLRVLPAHRLLGRVGERLDPIVATIDWSHDQLDPDGRRLYRRLAVFGVPFRARHVRTFAARAIAHGLSPLEGDLEASLDQLVGTGLLRVRPDAERQEPATGPDDPRGRDVREYQLPTLIREDATRRLEASGEATAAMWARANDLLALCELSHAELVVRSRVDLLEQLDAVHDDLVAALERARAAGEGTFLLRMSGALSEYWRARGRLADGRIWLDTALRLGPPTPTPERALVLHGAGMLANWQSDFSRAKTMLRDALAIRQELGRLEEAASTLNQLALIDLELGNLVDAERQAREGLVIRRRLGDETAISTSLNTLGGILQFGGRADEAQAIFEESIAIRRGLGDDAGLSVSLANLALVARDRGALDDGEAMLREALATRLRLGDRQRVSVVRHNLALVLFDRGDLDGARAELESAAATARELGDRLEAANALSDLGFVEAASGATDRAAELQVEALLLAGRIGAKGIVAQAIDGIAGLVARRGDREEAATLWAAAEQIRRDARYHLLLADRRRIDAEIAAARRGEWADRGAIPDPGAAAGVDPEARAAGRWAQAWAEGERLDLEAAIARARDAAGAAVGTAGASGKVAV
jgi:predicted ATPase